MQPRSLKLLEDIRISTAFILDRTSEISLSDYSNDDVLRPAVERHFMIIGEAMARLAREDKPVATALPDHPRIIAFRNIVAHLYDMVNDEIVWGIIKAELPPLLARVMELIDAEEQDR